MKTGTDVTELGKERKGQIECEESLMLMIAEWMGQIEEKKVERTSSTVVHLLTSQSFV